MKIHLDKFHSRVYTKNTGRNASMGALHLEGGFTGVTTSPIAISIDGEGKARHVLRNNPHYEKPKGPGTSFIGRMTSGYVEGELVAQRLRGPSSSIDSKAFFGKDLVGDKKYAETVVWKWSRIWHVPDLHVVEKPLESGTIAEVAPLPGMEERARAVQKSTKEKIHRKLQRVKASKIWGVPKLRVAKKSPKSGPVAEVAPLPGMEERARAVQKSTKEKILAQLDRVKLGKTQHRPGLHLVGRPHEETKPSSKNVFQFPGSHKGRFSAVITHKEQVVSGLKTALRHIRSSRSYHQTRAS